MSIREGIEAIVNEGRDLSEEGGLLRNPGRYDIVIS